MKNDPVIFITGTTGFLGGAVLARLVDLRVPCDLVLLIRGEDEEHCTHRLKKSVARYLEDSQIDMLLQKTTILQGCLTDGGWQSASSLDRVTHVLHLAANTSFGIEPGMRQTNVDGAISVASAFMKKDRLKRYVHVGTSMICGATPPYVVHEDQYPRQGVRHLVPYTAMKAEAESLLAHLASELPLVIARPSIIVGHTKLGCGPSGSIFWAFRAVHALQKISWELGSKIDVVPVDYVALSLVHLLLKPQLSHGRYHISSGESALEWSEIGSTFSAVLGESSTNLYRTVEFSEITEEYLRERLGSGPVKKTLRALERYYKFGGLDAVFDNSRLLAEGMASPPLFSSYLEQCIRTSDSRSVYHQMRDN
jgi:nucleoside-diphosphate-sugar epimerase